MFEGIKDFLGIKSTNKLVDEFIKLSKSEIMLKSKVSDLAKVYTQKVSDYENNKKFYSQQSGILNRVKTNFDEFTKSHLSEISEIRKDILNIEKRKEKILKKDKFVGDAVNEYNRRESLTILKSKLPSDKFSIVLKSLGNAKIAYNLICNENGEYLVFVKMMTKEKYLPDNFLFENTDPDDVVLQKIGVKTENIEKLAEFENNVYYGSYLDTSEHSNLIVNADEDAYYEWMSMDDIIYCEHIQKEIRKDLIKIFYPFDEKALDIVKSIENIELKKTIIKKLALKNEVITKYNELQKVFEKISSVLGEQKAIDLIEKSWSSDLSKKYPGSKWITLENGQHILINERKDGTAKVVFAGNSGLEHLTLDMKQKTTKEKVNLPEKEIARKIREEKSKLKKEVSSKHIENLKKIIETDPESGKINEALKNLSNKERKEFVENIHEVAKQKVLASNMANAIGGNPMTDIYDERPPIVPNKKMQEIMGDMELTPEQSLDILSNLQTLKEQQKAIKKAIITELKPDSELSKEIAEIAARKVDSESVIKTAIDEEFNKKAAEERVAMNYTFYNLLDENSGKRIVDTNTLRGSLDSLNNISQFLGSDAQISEKAIRFLGAKNAAILLASKLDTKDAEKLKEHISKNATDNIKKQIEDIQTRQAQVDELKKDIKEGTIYQSNLGLTIAKLNRKNYEDFGNLSGELNAAAEVYNSLNKKSDEILVQGGKNLSDMQKKLKSLGVDEKNVEFVKDTEGNYNISIKKDQFNNLIDTFKDDFKRDDFVRKAKQGGLIEKDWRPEFADKEIKLKDKNGKFTGETKPVYAQPSQQEGIKFATTMKRSILNFGAGLGKTYTYMGIVSELKSQGKLKDSFAVIAVPSRLRAEFEKDRGTFYSNFKMGQLDKLSNSSSMEERKAEFPDIEPEKLKAMTGQELKEEMIVRAKQGKYDFLITGHDTMKDEKTTELIKKHKPAGFIVDEAHEAISGEGTSDRFNSVKGISENSDVFVAGTGTLIQNSLDDLGQIMSITDPSRTDIKDFVKKYEKKINKNTSLFQTQTNNNLAKEYDKIMLTKQAVVQYTDSDGNVQRPKVIEKRNKVELSKEQSDRYKEIEHSYEQERKLKGKFGIFDKEKNSFVLSSDNKLINSDTHNGANTQITDAKRYEVRTIGGKDTAARRDINHKRNLYAGTHETNNKINAMVDTIKNTEGKHIIYYDTQTTGEAKKSLMDAMTKQLGLRIDQITAIDGGIKIGDNRNNEVKKFNENPDVKVMLMNSAGATGLNLQSADHIHVFSQPETYAKKVQLIARSMRKGRMSDTQVHHYDTATPFEIQKIDNVNKKEKISNAIGEYNEF